VTIRTIRLHPVEEDFYNALYMQTRSSFNDYVADGTLLNNYAHIFDLLLRMRQAVDHPYLVIYRQNGQQSATTVNGPAIANGSTVCSICHETPTDRVVSSCCQTAFCQSCARDYMSVNAGEGSIPCPCCQAPFSIDLNQVTSTDYERTATSFSASDSEESMPNLRDVGNVATNSILRRIDLAQFATSSKIEALTEELVNMRQSSPGSKAIVFSQFVNMLDLIRWRLHSDPCLASMGLGCTALHGGMNVKARDASLKSFREDCNVRVLLISLKAGGVALNLTVANHIYLMGEFVFLELLLRLSSSKKSY
jgi:DNA repair protein RAD16